jgi:dihydrofolate reductase
VNQTFAQITISLDGFGAGVNDSPEHPLGEGGLELHRWLFEPTKTEVDTQVAGEMMQDAGAFVIGRRMADLGIPEWGANGAFGKPVFIVTRRPHPVVVKGPTRFTYVTEGLSSALEQARAAAGERGVCVAGGPTVIRQALAEGRLDSLRLSIAPFLLGRGVPLLPGLSTPVRFTPVRVLASPLATHINYKVER